MLTSSPYAGAEAPAGTTAPFPPDELTSSPEVSSARARLPSPWMRVALTRDRHGRVPLTREEVVALNGMWMAFEPFKLVEARTGKGVVVSFPASFSEMPAGPDHDPLTIAGLLAIAEAKADKDVPWHAVAVLWVADKDRAEVERHGYCLFGACSTDGAKIAIYRKQAKGKAPRVNGSSTAQLNASAGNAPAPNESTWAEIDHYFGYSGFGEGDILSFNRLAIREGDETVLSIPGATGDVAMSFPTGTTVKQLVVMDIDQDGLDFAAGRLALPELDIARRRISQEVEACPVDEPADIAPMVASIVRVLNGADYTDDRIIQLCRRVIAAQVYWNSGNAIVNCWAPITTIAEQLGLGPTVRDLTALARDPDVIARARASEFAAPNGTYYERVLLGAGRDNVEVQLEKGDLFVPDPDRRRFDTLLCWEATPMASSAGLLPAFIDSLVSRVAVGGQMVLTGIRGSEIPSELVQAGHLLAERGFSVDSGFIPLPNRPRGSIDVPKYPFIVAINHGGSPSP